MSVTGTLIEQVDALVRQHRLDEILLALRITCDTRACSVPEREAEWDIAGEALEALRKEIRQLPKPIGRKEQMKNGKDPLAIDRLTYDQPRR